MGSPRGTRAGFSLIELLATLVLIGILAGLAVPSFRPHVDRLRLRATLDRLTADIYHARALAARGGAPVQLRFTPPQRDVCLAGYELVRLDPERVLRTVRFHDESPGVCVTTNVAAPMRVTGRGLLLGASRTIRATRGSQTERAVVSIAGRIYRSF